jgi:hypothetical protein
LHAPETQTCPEPQGRPHDPQFTGSDSRLEQPLLQAIMLPAHVHFPATQGSPAPHAVPHAPQFSGSASSRAQ